MTDAPGYLPPHELRALAGGLVDRDPTSAHPPGPSLASTSSPGLAGAAASPAGFAPTLPPDEPAALLLALARAAGEPSQPVELVPLLSATPTPDGAISAAGGPGVGSPGLSAPSFGPPSFAAPGISPSFGGADGFAPQLGGSQLGTSQLGTSQLGTSQLANSPSGYSPHGTSLAGPQVAGLPAGTSQLGGSQLGGPPSSAARGDDVPYWMPGQPASAPRVDPAPRTEPARGEPAAGTAFDPHAVRRDFPILEERVHGDKRLIWLDNAATTQKPRAVIDRLTHYYEHENSNVHRAAHELAARATDAYENARETTRRFLNAPSASEIVFVRGATEGINLIAKTWGKRHVERGDEIVVTHLEHHANIVPWQQLCAEVGARLRVAPVDDRGDVILEEYEKLMGSRTRLVAFTQVANALGTVTPAREMIDIAHRWGATVLLDGAQAVSHMAVDVQALDCEFYVFSGHKVFAPTGIGAVFGKREVLDAMPPWQGGGNMITDVTFERTQYQDPPWRFEAGTGNIADAAGLGAALDYAMRIGMPVIERYEHELLVYATHCLATVPGLRMIGTPRHKAGVLSFVLSGQRTEDVGKALDQDGIAVRAGHHCAQPILRRFGLEATVRASLAFYNTREDIDALARSLKRLQLSV